MDRFQKLLSEKERKKRELLGRLYKPRCPLVFVDGADQLETDDLKDLLAGLDGLHGLRVVTSSPLKKEPLKNTISLAPKDRPKALGAADFVILCGSAKPGEASELAEAWKYGTVPIAKLNGAGTLPYNAIQEKGNGFYFQTPTKWEIFAAVVRGVETYQFSYDWENLVREILKTS